MPISAFDPTYGYDLAALAQVPAPPAPPGFADFWRRTYDETRAQKLDITRREIESPSPAHELWEIEFNGWQGFRVGGWLAVPREANWSRGLVKGHGYGGREGADFDLPGPTCATIFPCARGFHRSARADLPADSTQHVLHGIEHRETYLHRGCIADLWASASVLHELFPHIENKLDYIGGSFGGGIGAVALAFDARFQRGYLSVPSFGNYPLRVKLLCTGSGNAVSQYFQAHPEVLEVLKFYDAATAAYFISIPMFVAPALSDPAVPPPGQWAVYNAIHSPKEVFVRQSGHPSLASEDSSINAQLNAWFYADAI